MKKEKKAPVIIKNELYLRKLFAGNLKKLRSDRHMSQMELASTADLSSNFINEMEHEKKWPSIETLAKLTRAFSIEPVLFFASENMIKVDDVYILKADLNDLITTAVNERIERYINDSQIKPESIKK